MENLTRLQNKTVYGRHVRELLRMNDRNEMKNLATFQNITGHLRFGSAIFYILEV